MSRRLLPAILALVALWWLGSALFVVDRTEYAVQLRFGEPVAIHLEPGLRAKFPWPIDTVARLDNRLMVLQNPRGDEPDKEYLTHDAQSGIGKNVVVTAYTCWRIRRDEAAVLRFLETMRERAGAEARIGDVVVAELGSALGSSDFTVLVSTDPAVRRWSGFMDDLRERCASRLDDYGIDVVDVRIQRLNFPDQNRRNVFDRMRAERQTIAAKYRSEGEEEATGIRARANRQREEILAAANEAAERTRGEADAEAARIYAEAHGQDPEFYRFIRTLDAYENAFQDGSVAILSGSGEFLELLNPPAGADGSGTRSGGSPAPRAREDAP